MFFYPIFCIGQRVHNLLTIILWHVVGVVLRVFIFEKGRSTRSQRSSKPSNGVGLLGGHNGSLDPDSLSLPIDATIHDLIFNMRIAFVEVSIDCLPQLSGIAEFEWPSALEWTLPLLSIPQPRISSAWFSREKSTTRIGKLYRSITKRKTSL